METKDRLKTVRKSLNLSQKDFSEKLGIHVNSVSNWENGIYDIPQTKFRLIVETFCVNPEWLKTGEGEMFLPEPPKEAQTIDETARRLGADETTVAIVTRFFALPPEKQKMFVGVLQELLSGVRVVPDSPPQPPETPTLVGEINVIGDGNHIEKNVKKSKKSS